MTSHLSVYSGHLQEERGHRNEIHLIFSIFMNKVDSCGHDQVGTDTYHWKDVL